MLRAWMALILAGAAWGATQPLSKIAVSEGYRHVGILFWQLSIGAVLLGTICLLRGTGLGLPRRALGICLVIALVGSVLPGVFSYSAAVHLPAGILSILLSSIPMIGFPIALFWGLEEFRWQRLLGLSLGFVGVLLLLGPSATLPEPGLVVWGLVALCSSLLYALEGNIVARYGTGGLDPIRTLYGASLFGAILTFPFALASGQWINPIHPWSAPDYAIVASSTLHAIAYSIFVWLLGRNGPVFTMQVSYLVTLFGVLWAMLVLGETYSGGVWLALGVMLLGVFFVQPRATDALVPAKSLGQNSA
jgi:drug/metabolite transporter (DMT)-like permease